MFVIIGIIVVLVGVLGGFALEGGKFMVLMQFAEFLIIGGAIIGALLISAPPTLLKKILKKVLGIFNMKKHAFNKAYYLRLLNLLYDFFQVARNNGLLAIEKHIEEPENSSIFANYPDILKQQEIIFFIIDSLRLMIIGNIPPQDIEAIMDTDAETYFQEGMKPGMLMQKMGDSLPGLGIVAAVLGIVITMGAIDGPAEEIGRKVAAALVGTFLGVLLSYGFIQPIATNFDFENEEEAKVFEVLKAGITAFASGLHPLYAVEFARRSIFAESRPTFLEMETSIKEGKIKKQEGSQPAEQAEG